MKNKSISLGQLCKIKTGKLDANAANENGKYPFFTCSVTPLKINTYAFDCEAVLIAGNGDLNVKHYNGKFNAYQRTYVVNDFNDEIYPRYTYYFLDAYLDTLRGQSIGGVIKYIKIGMLADALVPLPSIAEQRRIAAILDKADAIRRKRQQSLELADNLLKSVFLDMFGDPVTNPKGWEVHNFAEFASSRLGKMLDGKKQTGDYSYPYLANYNVQWFKCNTSTLREMDFDENDRIEFSLKKGDLLVCEGGEVGRTALWDEEIENCFFQKAIHRVRCRAKKALPEYILYVFFFYAKNKKFNDIIGGSSTIPHLTGKKLKELNFPIPPLNVQSRFSLIAQQAEKTKNCLQKHFLEADHTFKSLQQSFFG